MLNPACTAANCFGRAFSEFLNNANQL